MREMAERWAREFDPNSLVTLRKAMVRFDAERDLAKIRARVLYVLSRTDVLFPPSIAPDVMAKLSAAGVDATYVEIDSDFGHLASGADCAKWAPALRRSSTASAGDREPALGPGRRPYRPVRAGEARPRGVTGGREWPPGRPPGPGGRRGRRGTRGPYPAGRRRGRRRCEIRPRGRGARPAPRR